MNDLKSVRLKNRFEYFVTLCPRQLHIIASPFWFVYIKWYKILRKK